MNQDELLDQVDQQIEEKEENKYNLELIVYEIIIGVIFLLILKSSISAFINYKYFEFEILLIISTILLILIINDFSPYLSETYIKINYPMIISTKGRALFYFFICPLVLFQNGFSIKLSGALLMILGIYSTYRIYYK